MLFNNQATPCQDLVLLLWIGRIAQFPLSCYNEQALASSLRSEYHSCDQSDLKMFRRVKRTCCPDSRHVSMSIYILVLIVLTVTFTLFFNAQMTFSPMKYPYCVLLRLLLSIRYCRQVWCWRNQYKCDQSVSLETAVPLLTKYFTKWLELQDSIQQSPINNQTRFDENSLSPNKNQRQTIDDQHDKNNYSFIGRDKKLLNYLIFSLDLVNIFLSNIGWKALYSYHLSFVFLPLEVTLLCSNL